MTNEREPEKKFHLHGTITGRIQSQVPNISAPPKEMCDKEREIQRDLEKLKAHYDMETKKEQQEKEMVLHCAEVDKRQEAEKLREAARAHAQQELDYFTARYKEDKNRTLKGLQSVTDDPLQSRIQRNKEHCKEVLYGLEASNVFFGETDLSKACGLAGLPIGRIQKCVDDVLAFDKFHGIENENQDNLQNIIYNCLCLSGEAGEVANVAKKLWRDGDTPERRAHLQEEIIDCVIYISKLILVMDDFDFDKVWQAKHEQLYKRWAERKMGKRKEDTK